MRRRYCFDCEMVIVFGVDFDFMEPIGGHVEVDKHRGSFGDEMASVLGGTPRVSHGYICGDTLCYSGVSVIFILFLQVD